MEIKDRYKTIEMKGQGLFKDKGSKFIAYAYPVESEEEIKEHIKHLKKEHHNARHHCYAYRIGNHGEQYRANDDGEPSGTAGRPILGQLLSFDVSNILVVVVRYFGGTLLGVSGLINAYKNATADVLNNLQIIEKTIEEKYMLRFDYPLQNHVSKIIKENAVEIKNAVYETDCLLEISVRLKNEKQTYDSLSKINGLKIKKR
jgi:uncharacterized YigZ family protein